MDSGVRLEIPKRLIDKYSVSVPRYTSYPTAVEFAPFPDPSFWSDLIARQWQTGREGRRPSSHLGAAADGSVPGPLSVYVHVPFCHSLCYFCACQKEIPKNREGVRPLLEGIRKEAAFLADQGVHSERWQLHFGGGTPTFLEPAEFEEIVSAVSLLGPPTSSQEFAVEVDPRTVQERHFSMFSRLGVNRVSLGVQDFDPHVQQLINRVQPFELVREVVASLRQSGIGEINFDILYGLPDQTLERFRQTVERVCALRPSRIALYGYAHVTWIKKAQKALERAHLPTPEERLVLFGHALERLTAEGYEWIGFDHFALPTDPLVKSAKAGTLRRNFMGYTTHKGTEIVGLGPSAISGLSSGFGQNERETGPYFSRLRTQGHAVFRGFERRAGDALRGEVIEHLLCHARLFPAELVPEYQAGALALLRENSDNLREFERDGLLEIESPGGAVSGLRVTPVGRVFLRNIASIFDAYHQARIGEGKRVFSQAL